MFLLLSGLHGSRNPSQLFVTEVYQVILDFLTCEHRKNCLNLYILERILKLHHSGKKVLLALIGAGERSQQIYLVSNNGPKMTELVFVCQGS